MIKRVAAAIIEKNGRILIAQRKLGSSLGGRWEFPGGKLESEETPEQCLKRELKEELGIEIRETELTPHISHSNVDISSSYPGLNCMYNRNPFDYEMKPEFFNPDGYQEFQENKTTYFIWE